MKMKITTILFCMILVTPLLAISAAANDPPTAPSIDGPASGKIATQIMYGFCSSDPDGDNITICINWGDGTGEICIGPFPSGVCGTATHIWIKKGTYIIQAKASDGVAESNYSSLEVSIPRTKTIYNTPFMQHLLHFQNVFLVIKQLMKI